MMVMWMLVTAARKGYYTMQRDFTEHNEGKRGFFMDERRIVKWNKKERWEGRRKRART